MMTLFHPLQLGYYIAGSIVVLVEDILFDLSMLFTLMFQNI